MAELREIVTGLQFPEGPIAMDDGSIVLVEMKRGTLSRVDVEKGTIDVSRNAVVDRTARPSDPTARSTCATTAAVSSSWKLWG